MAEKLRQYQRIARTYNTFINAGILRPGQQLPSELSEAGLIFRTDKATIGRAYDILERQGSLLRLPGKGTFVNPQVTPTNLAASLATPTTIHWPTAEQQAPLHRYTPEKPPDDNDEALTYVREMVRRKIDPPQRVGGLRLEPVIQEIIKSLDAKDFPKQDVENMVWSVSRHLTVKSSIPLSRIEFATHRIIDDARTLRDTGVQGDFLRMSLFHPASYYTEPLLIYRRDKIKPQKSRVTETKSTSTKPYTEMTAGEIIASVRRGTPVSQTMIVEELPGISRGILTRFEKGRKTIINRQHVAAIAASLQRHGIGIDERRLQYLLTDAPLNKEPQPYEQIETYETQTARDQLQTVINSEISVAKVAADIGKSVDNVNGFYIGDDVDLSQGASGRTAPVNEANTQLNNFYKTVNDLRWFRAFTQQMDVPPTRIAGTGLKLLYLTMPKVQNETEAERKWRSKIETGKRIPTAATFKESLQKLKLDLTSKAIQYLMLYTIIDGNKKPTVQDKPMKLEELRTCDLRTLMRYLRRLKGATQTDVAEAIGYHPNQYTNLENGNATHPISATAVEAFIGWLELDPEKSELANILKYKQQDQTKSKKKRIQTYMLEHVFKEKYLFQEHIDQLLPFDLPEQDEQLRSRLQTLHDQGATFGDVIEELVSDEPELTSFAKRAQISVQYLRKIRRGERKPHAGSITNIADAKGYGPLHPITHDLYGYTQLQKAA